MRTGYKDFAYYLFNTYIKSISQDDFFDNFKMLMDDLHNSLDYYDLKMDMDHEGSATLPDETKVQIVLDMLSSHSWLEDNWSNLEEALGTFDIGAIIGEFSGDLLDEDGDIDYSKQDDFVSQVSGYWEEALVSISRFFCEWIESISNEEEKVCPLLKWKKAFKKEKSIFLTFNYTDTLEDVYHVDPIVPVCHIHGSYDCPQSIIFGHEPTKKQGPRFETIGANSEIESIDKALEKNIQIDKMKEFLGAICEAVGKIDEIICVGYSFGEVDAPYIKAANLSAATKKAKWKIYSYNGGDMEEEVDRLAEQLGGNRCRITVFSDTQL